MTRTAGTIARFFLVKRTYETVDGRVYTFKEKIWDRDGPYEYDEQWNIVRVKKGGVVSYD